MSGAPSSHPRLHNFRMLFRGLALPPGVPIPFFYTKLLTKVPIQTWCHTQGRSPQPLFSPLCLNRGHPRLFRLFRASGLCRPSPGVASLVPSVPTMIHPIHRCRIRNRTPFLGGPRNQIPVLASSVSREGKGWRVPLCLSPAQDKHLSGPSSYQSYKNLFMQFVPDSRIFCI
jgi:hypothetical protein